MEISLRVWSSRSTRCLSCQPLLWDTELAPPICCHHLQLWVMNEWMVLKNTWWLSIWYSAPDMHCVHLHDIVHVHLQCMLCCMFCLTCNVHCIIIHVHVHVCFSFSCRRTTYLLAAFLVWALYTALALCVCCIYIPVIIVLPSLDRFLGVSGERSEQSSSSSSLSCEFHTMFIGPTCTYVVSCIQWTCMWWLECVLYTTAGRPYLPLPLRRN